MTNYTKGATYEREFCKRMEAHHYIAIRSAGSHGLIDVVLIPTPLSMPFHVSNKYGAIELSPRVVKVCQLKRGDANTTNEKERFKQISVGTVHKLWVSKKDREAEVIELL